MHFTPQYMSSVFILNSQQYLNERIKIWRADMESGVDMVAVRETLVDASFWSFAWRNQYGTVSFLDLVS